uniref:Aminotransferase class I/classII domain-containing protein n=1 Tax=Seriola lalandi dorsalis TaxID=1841481 RepID=A0A3B4WYF6_SERLL
CIYPQLINSNKLPADVRQRSVFCDCSPESVISSGSYTATAGIPELVHRVSDFIMRRDGGATSHPENIYISPGAHGNSLYPASSSFCNPVALYVINPGNPSGHVQSRKSMQEVIRFVSEKRLFLLADEVAVLKQYYPSICAHKRTHVQSCDMMEISQTAGNSARGETVTTDWIRGLRGGYVELVNLDRAVMKYIHNLFSKDSCAPVLGQLALDLILLGFYCQPVEGGAFAFPRVYLPPKAIQKAKEVGMKPDTYYCMRLLEETGLLVSPGSEYGQKEGTYHIREVFPSSTHTKEDVKFKHALCKSTPAVVKFLSMFNLFTEER